MLDINKLKTGYKVAFGGKVEKTVSHTCRSHDSILSVSFDDGTILGWSNSLWELAELRRPTPPSAFCLASLNDGGRFVHNKYLIDYTPEAFLYLLRRDVAALEAAGVEASSIHLTRNLL